MPHFQALPGETLRQKFCEASVFLDRQNLCSLGQEKLGERAKSRSYFDDVVIRCHLRLIYNPARQISIVQKVLAETFHRRNADFAERGGYFGEFHNKIAMSAGARPLLPVLFTKSM